MNDAEMKGIIPNAIDHMFDLIRDDTSGCEISLAVSYLEVYKEVIRDLIDPSKSNLQARTQPPIPRRCPRRLSCV